MGLGAEKGEQVRLLHPRGLCRGHVTQTPEGGGRRGLAPRGSFRKGGCERQCVCVSTCVCPVSAHVPAWVYTGAPEGESGGAVMLSRQAWLPHCPQHPCAEEGHLR